MSAAHPFGHMCYSGREETQSSVLAWDSGILLSLFVSMICICDFW